MYRLDEYGVGQHCRTFVFIIQKQSFDHCESWLIILCHSKDFLNGIFKEFEIKINFSKDYICNKNIIKDKKEYSDFINELDSINPDRKLNSMFSKRLKI